MRMLQRSGNHRFHLVLLVALAAAGLATPASAGGRSQGSAGPPVEICHRTDRTGYVSLQLPPAAVPAHLRHGDCAVDDANPCSDDLCDPSDGCVSVDNSAQCSDGDVCTELDYCSGGECVGGAPPAERCDGTDSDCDGLVDCADPDCNVGGVCELAISFDPGQSFCALGSDCTSLTSVSFSVGDAALPVDFELSIDEGDDGTTDDDLDPAAVLGGTAPDFHVTLTLPIGNHALLVTAEDAAGKVGMARIPFAVADCKAPTPICINGLAIELMPVVPAADVDGDGDEDAGAMTIYASDFLASPVADCSEPVRYSINRVGDSPDIDASSIVVTCDDPATLLVEVYGWDAVLNADSCQTYVLVQDNRVDCP